MSWTITVRASAGSRTTPSSPWWATRSNRRGARRATPSTTTSTPRCRPSGRRRTSRGPVSAGPRRDSAGRADAGPVARRRSRTAAVVQADGEADVEGDSRAAGGRRRARRRARGARPSPPDPRDVAQAAGRRAARRGASPSSRCARRLMAGPASRKTAFGAAACTARVAVPGQGQGQGQRQPWRQAARPSRRRRCLESLGPARLRAAVVPGGQRQGRGDKKRSR